MKTEGTTTLRLLTATRDHTHTFHILGRSDFGCHYGGILGQDFWKDNEASINYCNLTITMGEVTMKFDENYRTVNEKHKLTLTENIVRQPTKSKGRGLIFKREIISGVYLAKSVTQESDR